jgi:hypothetical protein
MLQRVANIDPRRPEVPLSFQGAFPGWLTWEAPDLQNFTHYRLRVDQDAGLPEYEMPPGQRAIQMFKGRVFFLSTYNAVSRLESPLAVLAYDTEADFRKFAAQIAGGVMVAMNYTMNAASFPIPLNPAPSACFDVTFYLAQDGTGGRVPSWHASFKNAPTTALDGTANTLSWVTFSYRKVAGDPAGDDAWYCVGFDTGLATL